ncbi:MAG TPA: ribosome silencing factor [Candidatus Limnocylindrales bacterium]|nr:ribosome silencing factor [Candidatus Limnocylindrales bacterium]
MNQYTPRDLATAAADLAADGKAFDIIVLDLGEVSSVADYFVLASGHSHIQVESVCDRIVEGIQERLAARPISVEGLENAQWALLDYGSVVVHVFQENVREIYDLERLWSHAPHWEHEDSSARPVARKNPDRPKRSARV